MKATSVCVAFSFSLPSVLSLRLCGAQKENPKQVCYLAIAPFYANKVGLDGVFTMWHFENGSK